MQYRRPATRLAVFVAAVLCLSPPLGQAVADTGETVPPVHVSIPIDPANGVARAGSIVTSGSDVRFEVLTSGVVRMEYSPTGQFTDAPSDDVINRNLPTPSFTASSKDGVLTIATSAMQLSYDEGSGAFGPTNTTVQLAQQPYQGSSTAHPDWSATCVVGGTCQSQEATLTPSDQTYLAISGAGFVSQGGAIDGLNAQGASATWNLLGVPPGTTDAQLTVRYATTTDDDTSVRVTVAGEDYDIALPGTGGPDKWATASVPITVTPGQDSVVATCPAGCSANLDTLSVTAPGAAATPAFPAGQLGGYNRSYDNVTYGASNFLPGEPQVVQSENAPAQPENTCSAGQQPEDCRSNLESFQPGLLNTSGWFLLDDSSTALIGDSGWVENRPSDGDLQDGYLFAYGTDYSSALADLADLTGHAPLLPINALGTWYSTLTPQTPASVQNTVSTAAANGVSLDQFSVDTYWQDPTFAGWEPNPSYIPDLGSFIAWAKQNHMGVDVATHAHIPTTDPKAASTLLNAGGQLGTSPCPLFGPTNECYTFDFGNQSQSDAFFSLVNQLNKQGQDFSWFDFCCEASTSASVPGVDTDGWAGQLFAQQLVDNGRRGVVLGRIGATNLDPQAGRFPSGAWSDHRAVIHFTGDAHATWDLLANEVQRTTAEASIGEPYVSDDIGGFWPPPNVSSGISDDLYLRWVQMGVFQPIMRLHGTSGEVRLPWDYDKSTQAIGDAFLRLRESLVPYLYSLSQDVIADGMPMNQPLYLNYPDAQDAYTHPDEYTMGSNVLVAPVTTEGDDPATTLWIPPGQWTDWFTGQTFVGPRTVTVSTPMDQMPVFVKAGGIVPLQPGNGHAETSHSAPLTFKVAAGSDGSYSLYQDAGSGLGYQSGQSQTTAVNYSETVGAVPSSTLTVAPPEGTYPTAPSTRQYSEELDGISQPSSVTVNGQPLDPSKWSYDTSKQTLTVHTPTTPASDTLTITQIGGTPVNLAAVTVGPSTATVVQAGSTSTVRATLQNTTAGPVTAAQLTLTGRPGWTIQADNPTTAATLPEDGTLTTTWTVSPPAGSTGAVAAKFTVSGSFSDSSGTTWAGTAAQSDSIQITSPPTATFQANVKGTTTITTMTTASSPPTLTATGLPDGITLVDDGDGTAHLTGTIQQAGVYPITITAKAGSATDTQQLVLTVPLAAPYLVTSGTPDAATVAHQGSTFTITAAGSDIFADNPTVDQAASIYLKSGASADSTAVVHVDSQENTDPWAKAGLVMRNDATGWGQSGGYVVLATTPGNGVSLQWDSDGDGYLDKQVPVPATAPVSLKLVRSGTSYTGYYSSDGTTWQQVGDSVTPAGGSATAPQDVGLIDTSHSPGVTSTVQFSGFSVTPPVALLPTATSATPSVATTTVGRSTKISATVRGQDARPTGTVAVTAGSTTLATAALKNGKAKLTVPTAALPIGVDQLAVGYSGDSTYAPSSDTVALQLNQASSTTTLALSTSSTDYGRAVKAKITVPVVADTTAAILGGTGTATLPGLPAGSYTLTVQWPGTTDLEAATVRKTLKIRK